MQKQDVPGTLGRLLAAAEEAMEGYSKSGLDDNQLREAVAQLAEAILSRLNLPDKENGSNQYFYYFDPLLGEVRVEKLEDHWWLYPMESPSQPPVEALRLFVGDMSDFIRSRFVLRA